MKKIINHIYLFIFACLTCFTLGGCNKEKVKITEIESNYEFAEISEIKLEVNESYNIKVMITDKTISISDLTFKVSNSSILEVQDNETIIAKKTGKAQVQIFGDENKQQAIPVTVYNKGELKDSFTMDKGRLYNKNVIFYGDSITQYESWEGEYVLHLKDYYSFNHKNFAKSGSTLGFSKRYSADECGVGFMYNHKTDNQWADYIFILYGTNDIDEDIPVGEFDSEMLSNYDDANPTYKGSLNYAVKILREHNSSARIIFLELLYRDGMRVKNYNKAILEQSFYNEVKFIPMYDLWGLNNAHMYMKDGLHPNSEGYRLMFERIISK